MVEMTECSKCSKLGSCAMKRADSDIQGCGIPEFSKNTIPKVWNTEPKEEEIIE